MKFIYILYIYIFSSVIYSCDGKGEFWDIFQKSFWYADLVIKKD